MPFDDTLDLWTYESRLKWLLDKKFIEKKITGTFRKKLTTDDCWATKVQADYNEYSNNKRKPTNRDAKGE